MRKQIGEEIMKRHGHAGAGKGAALIAKYGDQVRQIHMSSIFSGRIHVEGLPLQKD